MDKNMIIKVCGMRDPENIRSIAALGIDWMGLIFYPKSPRYVSQMNSKAGIIPDYPSFGKAGSAGKSEGRIKRVGVFVDDMPQNIITRVYNYNLDIVQLHGSESPVMIDNLRRTLDPDIRPGVKIMKAISVSDSDDVAKYKEYEGCVDYFLFDTSTPMKGGSGKMFDWTVLDAYDGETPFLLSGGIGPADAQRVKAFSHPRCIGIDLNSKFESAPAVKNENLLRAFINEVRA